VSGADEGNIFQGELRSNNFLLAPSTRLRALPHAYPESLHVRLGYASGGGIMGAPGRLALLKMLKDSKGAA